MNSLHKLLISTLILAGLGLNLAEAAAPAPLPRTGQTPTAPLNPAPIGADGALEKGVAWRSPRFTDNVDGTVTDSLTDLVWLKNANCTDTVGGVRKNVGAYPGVLNWTRALIWSNALASGKCGLKDGSAAGDWRLPNRRELESLVDLSQAGPALPAGHPFLNVLLTRYYWSSSTDALVTNRAWSLNLSNSDPGRSNKISGFFVWPVRDTTSQPSIAIGKIYQGGIIFYVDGSGAHGLIAAAQDQSAGMVWWNGAYIYTSATATAVGTGQANTRKIVAAQGAGSYAASLADTLVLNGYSDWFLPSKDELNLMFHNIGPGAPAPLNNIGMFSGNYWSSSEFNYGNAWFQNFGDGNQYDYQKDYTYSVRTVRAF